MTNMISRGISLAAAKRDALRGSKKWVRFKARYISPAFAGTVGWRLVRFVILVGLCYIILYPFFIKLINTFKIFEDFGDPTVRFIPKSFTTENLSRVVKQIGYFKSLGNTLLISTVTAVVQTAVASMVGYGFARYKFRFSGGLFFMVILSMVIPPQTIMIPLYLRFRFFLGFINLINTPLPMFILSLTGFGIKNALYIFLYRQFFRNAPKELEEAAYLDGCGGLGTYIRIMMPSAGSITITILLLSFSWQWTDTVYSSLFLQEFDVMSNIIGKAGSGLVPIMAANDTNIAALLAILPVALIYIFAQKYFVQSLDRSGLVG